MAERALIPLTHTVHLDRDFRRRTGLALVHWRRRQARIWWLQTRSALIAAIVPAAAIAALTADGWATAVTFGSAAVMVVAWGEWASERAIRRASAAQPEARADVGVADGGVRIVNAAVGTDRTVALSAFREAHRHAGVILLVPVRGSSGSTYALPQAVFAPVPEPGVPDTPTDDVPRRIVLDRVTHHDSSMRRREITAVLHAYFASVGTRRMRTRRGVRVGTTVLPCVWLLGGATPDALLAGVVGSVLLGGLWAAACVRWTLVRARRSASRLPDSFTRIGIDETGIRVVDEHEDLTTTHGYYRSFAIVDDMVVFLVRHATGPDLPLRVSPCELFRDGELDQLAARMRAATSSPAS